MTLPIELQIHPYSRCEREPSMSVFSKSSAPIG